MLYLGCPQWSNPAWKNSFFAHGCQQADMLHQYSQVFNTVEGNTTFYADPKAEVVKRWAEQTHPDFRFTFKFPKRFSHDNALNVSQADLSHWFDLMEPVLEKVGSLMLQLPAAFAPEHVNRLAHFIDLLPAGIPYAIEVRNPLFFDKAANEQALNRLLHAHNIERVIMDTRALFAVKPYNEAIIDAQGKKPRLPVHAIALSQKPIVRFVIASMSDDFSTYTRPWLTKIKQWLDEGRSPYVFLHTADNDKAPQLVREFATQLFELGVYDHKARHTFAGEQFMQQQIF